MVRTVGIRDETMPSLFRFLTIIAILAALDYVGLYALAHFVEPKPREITVSVPPEKFFKNR
jgi:hypothetical protein